jgi:hypothetical protein
VSPDPVEVMTISTPRAARPTQRQKGCATSPIHPPMPPTHGGSETSEDANVRTKERSKERKASRFARLHRSGALWGCMGATTPS